MPILGRTVLGLAMLGATMAAHAAEEFDLPSGRPGAGQPIYRHPVAHPAARAALSVVGSAAVYAARKNVLIRAADDFAAPGITAAIADAPSDRPGGVNRAFRASGAQATDTAAVVVAFLCIRAPVAGWLAGTSNGTIPAVNAGVRLGPSQIAGVGPPSSAWIGGTEATDFQTLRVPTLIVHSHKGGCLMSPFDQGVSALASLHNAPATNLLVVAGSLSGP